MRSRVGNGARAFDRCAVGHVHSKRVARSQITGHNNQVHLIQTAFVVAFHRAGVDRERIGDNAVVNRIAEQRNTRIASLVDHTIHQQITALRHESRASIVRETDIRPRNATIIKAEVLDQAVNVTRLEGPTFELSDHASCGAKDNFQTLRQVDFL